MDDHMTPFFRKIKAHFSKKIDSCDSEKTTNKSLSLDTTVDKLQCTASDMCGSYKCKSTAFLVFGSNRNFAG